MNDVFLVNDKEDLSVENLRLNLIDKVKKAVESYHRRVDSIENKARGLEDKQKSEVGLTNEEEQLLLKLHMELNSIDSKANPVSAELLQTTFVENFFACSQMNHGVWIDVFPLDGMSFLKTIYNIFKLFVIKFVSLVLNFTGIQFLD